MIKKFINYIVSSIEYMFTPEEIEHTPQLKSVEDIYRALQPRDVYPDLISNTEASSKKNVWNTSHVPKSFPEEIKIKRIHEPMPVDRLD